MRASPIENSEATRSYFAADVPGQIGPYRLEGTLGEGGMGMVFVAVHTLMNRRAAIKVVRPALKHSEALVRRFRQEIAALGKIPDHANLVRAQYADEEAGLLYLVMDYVEGVNINQLLSVGGPMPAPLACGMIRQAAQGLDAIHRAGMVHRDLKPSNLMISEDGVVKILDLGLARLQGEEFDELTPANCQLGTVDFQAPEQASDPRRVDIRADIYSLGCTLFKLITGQAPFADCLTPAAKIQKRAEGWFPPLPAHAPGKLAEVLAKMTALAPGDRFQTPEELVEALTPFLGGAPRVADLASYCRQSRSVLQAHEATSTRKSPAAGAATRPHPAPARRTVRGPVLAGLAVVLIGAGILVWWRPWDLRDDPGGEIVPTPAPLVSKSPPDTGPSEWTKTPPKLDQLPELQWHDLFDHPPTQVVFNKADGAAMAHFDPRAKQLLVTSPRSAVFLFGQLERPSFTYQVSLMQIGWSSGSGVVFGYRPDDPTSGRLWPGKFQYIMLNTQRNPKGDLAWFISRGSARVDRLEDNINVSLTSNAKQELATPLGEQLLEIVVERGSLREIRVNGAPVGELSSVNVNRRFTKEDYTGAIGTLTMGTSCTYRKANIKIHASLN